jgi:hypothetical protein
MRGLERRLGELERGIGANKITLLMADGTTRMVSSWRLLGMFGEAAASDMKDDTGAVLDSVSDNCLETGNGRMIEAIKVLAAGAAVGQCGATDNGYYRSRRVEQRVGGQRLLPPMPTSGQRRIHQCPSGA